MLAVDVMGAGSDRERTGEEGIRQAITERRYRVRGLVLVRALKLYPCHQVEGARQAVVGLAVVPAHPRHFLRRVRGGLCLLPLPPQPRLSAQTGGGGGCRGEVGERG